MLRTKEPAGATAGAPVDLSEQGSLLPSFDSPLRTTATGNVGAERPTVCRGDRRGAAAREGGDTTAGVMNTQEEKATRHKRSTSAVSPRLIVRSIKAVIESGLDVTSIEVRLDGTLVLGTASQPQLPETTGDVFDQWRDRL